MKPACETRAKLLSTALRLLWEMSYGSVSVDDICRQAGVKKGSFYHFFPSKTDLAAAALEAHCEEIYQQLRTVFSPERPPLERIAAYCGFVLERQQAKLKQYGKVCGCPLVTLGAELSTQNETIRQKTVNIIDRYAAFFENAAREIPGIGDPASKARQLVAYAQGLLLQAKVRNDLAPLREMASGMFQLLQSHQSKD